MKSVEERLKKLPELAESTGLQADERLKRRILRAAEEKKEVHKQREVSRPASYQNLVKTGDLFNQPLVIALAACGLVMLALGIRRTRKNM